jgi:hypothetical protein
MALPAAMGGGQGEMLADHLCSSKINAKLQTPAGQALDDGVFGSEIGGKELSVLSRTKGKYGALVHGAAEWIVRNLQGAPES